MKLHLPDKLRAALLACFTFVATTVGSASADYEWIGPNEFTAGDWNDSSNWRLTGDTTYPSLGNGPATPRSGEGGNRHAWDKLVFDGKSGTTPELEGWEFKMEVKGNAKITTSVKKLQGGSSINIGKGSTLNLTLATEEGNCGGDVNVGLGGIFNMRLEKDFTGGNVTARVSYGDIATAHGHLKLSSSAEGTARTFATLTVAASLTSTAVSSDTTELHEYTFCTFEDVSFSNFSSTITNGDFVNAGDNTVLTDSDENIGKYSVVKDDTTGTIKLYYVTGAIDTLTWNGGTSGTWNVGSTTWLSPAGTEATYTNGRNVVVFNTENADITVSGAIDAYKVSVQANTTFTLSEGADLSMDFLDIAEGATLTAGTLTSLRVRAASGTGNLVLTMNSNADYTGNSTVSLSRSQFGSVTIAGGVFAVNNNENVKSSDLGSSDLIMANNTTYVIRNDVGADATVTSGDIKLQGTMYLQVYGSVSNTTLNNDIVEATADADTAILKTDGGTVTLTGGVTVDKLYVAAGTLKLGSGANVTVSQVRLSENGSDGNKLVIESGATLTVSGTNNTHATSNSLILAHWPKSGFLEINGGTLNAAGAMALVSWDGTGTLSVNSGTAKLRGLDYWAHSGFRGTVNLGTADGTEEAVLELGQDGIKNLNDNAVLNLGNGTLKAVADTFIGRNTDSSLTQGTLKLIGTGTGTKFDTNGHNMIVGVNTGGDTANDPAINVTGGGNMVKAGKGTLTIKGNLEAGRLTIEQGELRLNGATSVTQMIVNDGTLAFGEGASLSIASLSGLEYKGTYSDSLIPGDNVNGYATGSYTVIRSSTENGTTTVTGLTTVSIAGTSYNLTASGGNYVVEFNSTGDYFVNDGTLEYGSEGNSMYSDTTTGIILNGGNLTLAKNLNSNVQTGPDKTGKGIVVHKAATVTINAGVTLAQGNLTAHAATQLDGGGVFEIGNSLALPTNVRLNPTWTGTVYVKNKVFAGDSSTLDNLANAKSWVGLSGCSGWLTLGGTIAANLLLENSKTAEGEYRAPAVELTAASNQKTQTFSGSIKGRGNFVLAMTGPNQEGTTGVTYVFSGDVSQWTGTFDSSDATADSTTPNKTFSLKFTGTGNIGTSINNETDRTLNVTIGGAGDRTMSGSITNTGTLDLTVEGGGTKTFTGGKTGMTATTMTVAADTSVTLSGTTTIGTLNANSTLTNTGALTITTALQETIANADTTLKVASEYSSTLTHEGGAVSTDGNGYITSGYGYVIESTGNGTLEIDNSLITGNYLVRDNNLLYQIGSGDTQGSVYYINASTNYADNTDVAKVGSGKTIRVSDGVNLTMEKDLTEGVILKTAGSGSVTLNRGAVVSVGSSLLSTEGTDIGLLVLASGTTLEITSSTQMSAVQRAKTIEVKDGASFSHRVIGGTISDGVKFEICGDGDGSAGSGALIFCSDTASEGDCTVGGTVTLKGAATICTNSNEGRRGILGGEVVGKGYTLTKTGTNELRFERGSIGSDKTLDAALHVKQGAVRLNFSDVDMATEGAGSRKITGKVTLETDTTLNVYDGYTELAGGLKVNGTSATLNAELARGVNISGLVEGGANAVLHIDRQSSDNTQNTQNTLVLGADNSATFTGTWQVAGNWKLRADNANALGNGTLNLNHASAVLEYGQGVDTVNLVGLNGIAGATVNGGGTGKLTFTGSGTYNYAGTLSGVQEIVKDGSGTQTLASVADAVYVALNDGTLAIANESATATAAKITGVGTLTTSGNGAKTFGGNVDVSSATLGGGAITFSKNVTLHNNSALNTDVTLIGKLFMDNGNTMTIAAGKTLEYDGFAYTAGENGGSIAKTQNSSTDHWNDNTDFVSAFYSAGTTVSEVTMTKKATDNKTVNFALDNVHFINEGGTTTLNHEGNRLSALEVSGGTVQFGADATLSGLTGTAADGAVKADGGARTLTIDQSADTEFKGTIANGTEAAHVLSITKQNTGTLTLSGENTYTGATAVTDGKLKVTGSIGNTSSVAVSGDGVLEISGESASVTAGGITATTNSANPGTAKKVTIGASGITGTTSGEGDTLKTLGEMSGMTLAFVAENTAADIRNVTMRDVKLVNGAVSMNGVVAIASSFAAEQAGPAPARMMALSAEADTGSAGTEVLTANPVKSGGSISGTLTVDIDGSILSSNAGNTLSWTILQGVSLAEEEGASFTLKLGDVLTEIVRNGKPTVTLSGAWVNNNGTNSVDLTSANLDSLSTGSLLAGSVIGGNLTLTIKDVPEPTTGTLSVLALAALAARRRRRE